MATARIVELIDKDDTFELVRDELAAILVVESANQEALASAADKDPRLWKLDVFSETTNPWQAFIDAPQSQKDVTPIINIWYDAWNTDRGRSNNVKRQQGPAIFNIDCYGYGVSSADETSAGHVLGDAKGAKEAQRALKLVRNILMHGAYTYLGFQGQDLVAGREVSAINTFQPNIEGREIEKVHGVRLALSVSINELSPQVVPTTLDLISILVKRQSDGKVILEADFAATPP